jgi:hypothetical protein
MKYISKILLFITIMGFASCADQDSTTTHTEQNSPPPKGKMDKAAFGGAPSVFISGDGSSVEKFETSMK